jgi:hypothetical protein
VLLPIPQSFTLDDIEELLDVDFVMKEGKVYNVAGIHS